jgi:tRNA1(Val) A37 N6-methylase TrmN6
MLELAKVGPRDFVIDLGFGDCRIVLTVAQRYSARGVGVDVDRSSFSKATRKRSGAICQQRMSFKEQDGLHRLRLTTPAFLRGVALGAPASRQPRHAVPIRPVSRR